jgi:very-short-patch-repair endonuclease
MKQSMGERVLSAELKKAGLPPHEQEVRFHPTRRWRFDFAWPELKLAVEVEGGVFSNGRHSRGKGFTEDCIKYNSAVQLGWRVLRFTTGQVTQGEAVQVIKELINQEL